MRIHKRIHRILQKMDKKIINGLINSCRNGSKINLPGLYFLLIKRLRALEKDYQPNKSDLDLPDDEYQKTIEYDIEDSRNEIELVQELINHVYADLDKSYTGSFNVKAANPFSIEFRHLREYQPNYKVPRFEELLCIILKTVSIDKINTALVISWLRNSGEDIPEAFQTFESCIEIISNGDEYKAAKYKEELLLLKAEYRTHPSKFEVQCGLGNIFLPPPQDYIEIPTTLPPEKILHYFSLFYSEKNDDNVSLLLKEEVDIILKYGLSYPGEPHENQFLIRLNNKSIIRAIFYEISTRCGVGTNDMARFLKSWFINFNNNEIASIRAHMTNSIALKDTKFAKHFR